MVVKRSVVKGEEINIDMTAINGRLEVVKHLKEKSKDRVIKATQDGIDHAA
jgi:hypothetical protein